MSAVTAAEALLDWLDTVDDTVDVDTEGRDRQVIVILTAAAEHATESIRRGRPGYAHFQLATALLRAQRVLDGTVPDGSAR
jgi:hypothetical protein